MPIHISDGRSSRPADGLILPQDPEHGGASADGAAYLSTPPRIVFVYAPWPGAVRDRLQRVLFECRIDIGWIADPAAISQLPRGGDCGIALVAAAGTFTPDAPVLDAVSALKHQGYTVLCYRDGDGDWPLAAQCRLLLAGASHLLDSAHAAWGEELRARVSELVEAATERHHDDRRIAQQMLGLGMVGTSPGVKAVFRWIMRVGPLSELPVLISGETGTGKELVARSIHRLDPRRGHGPFIPVNCGAISAGLAESELFGHRRGAFTGADHDRKGLVRAARGGVLFLDEIGDLDASLQGKLLRVLQEHRILAVGDDHEVPVDVRVIAATNRDLEEMVRGHALRADLFHRLNVLSIRLPALRERAEDMEPLVQHFISRSGVLQDGETVVASPEFLHALRRLDLPGNVRQLDNVVQRALATRKRGDPLRLTDLAPEFWRQLADGPSAPGAGAGESVEQPVAADAPAAPPLSAVALLDASGWKLDGALDRCEEQMLAAALAMSGGNRAQAARRLGISARTMFNKLRKHQLTA